MAKQFEATFTVKGRGEFPEDMLRFDRCRAASDADQTKIDWKHGDPVPEGAGVLYRREITLIAKLPHKWAEPTRGRWESFGWSVTTVEEPVLA